MIASSGAIRLKPEGIFVKNRLTAADWFLNQQDEGYPPKKSRLQK